MDKQETNEIGELSRSVSRLSMAEDTPTGEHTKAKAMRTRQQTQEYRKNARKFDPRTAANSRSVIKKIIARRLVFDNKFGCLVEWFDGTQSWEDELKLKGPQCPNKL